MNRTSLVLFLGLLAGIPAITFLTPSSVMAVDETYSAWIHPKDGLPFKATVQADGMGDATDKFKAKYPGSEITDVSWAGNG